MALSPASPPPAETAAAHATLPRAFPVRALLERLGPLPEQHPWAGFLPAPLRPVTAQDLAASSPASCGAGDESCCSAAAATPSERPAAPSPLAGNVWALSQDPQGCREVQRAIESAADDEEKLAIAHELRGRVFEALRCPHANYVLQKCIVNIRPQAVQFVVDELMARSGLAAQAARHKYGCRIVQRLLEHCKPEQVHGLMDLLLADSVALCRHSYGNYVMQHILEHGCAERKARILEVLMQNAATIGTDPYGCAVVRAAMSHTSHKEQAALARVLLREPGVLEFLAYARHGHVAVRDILQVLDGAEREEAKARLAVGAEALKSSRYGRVVAACLRQGDSGRRGSGSSAASSSPSGSSVGLQVS